MSNLLYRKLAEKKRVASPPVTQESYWRDLTMRIKQGNVIPVLGNSVWGDGIFNLGGSEQTGSENLETDDTPLRTVDEMLAELWAQELGYPFPSPHSLEQVAQYKLVNSRDAEQAKTDYLLFLKTQLLDLFKEAEPSSAGLVDELRAAVLERSFGEMVTDLELPRYARSDDNPLRLLARLNLPIYITTSYYDLMERALVAEKRSPVTKICFWRGEPPNVLPEHRPDRNLTIDPLRPLVYHLLGYERYPSTLVLTEDDYLEFLTTLATDNDAEKSIIPTSLYEAIADSTLLLLGYRLHSWDFRALFRGVILRKARRFFSLAIQLEPDPKYGISDVATARRYLEAYFATFRSDNASIIVEWSGADAFVQKLWQQWNEARQL